MSEALSFLELESAAKPKDETAPAVTPVETTKAAASEAVVEETKPQFTDADVTAYQYLRDKGISVDTAEQFIQAKAGLDVLSQALEKNPKAILDELWKTRPDIAENVEEVFSDAWYERKGKRMATETTQNGSVSRTTTSEPDPRIDKLTREMDALKQEKLQEQSVRQQAEIKKTYDTSFDALVAKLPKEVPEEKRDYIRLKAEKLLWQDPQAQARVRQGIYTDVPKYFAEASRRVTAETKTAADKAHEARAAVESNAGKEIIPAAETVNGAQTQTKSGVDPIWGNIDQAEIQRAYK